MKCIHTKANKAQCKANAIHNSQYCFSHDPYKQEEKADAVRKGGLALKPRRTGEQLDPMSIKSPKDILTLLEDTINRVRTEPFTHQKANSLGFLSGVYIKTLETLPDQDRPLFYEVPQRSSFTDENGKVIMKESTRRMFVKDSLKEMRDGTPRQIAKEIVEEIEAEDNPHVLKINVADTLKVTGAVMMDEPLRASRE